MSISTRINGFTAWINLRLSNSTGQLLDNVLVDLLKGYNMKILLESKKPFNRHKFFLKIKFFNFQEKELRPNMLVLIS